MITASPKLWVYAVIAAVSCLAGLAFERPEPVVFGAPFLLLLAIAAALPRPPVVDVRCRLDRERALEDDEVPVTIEVEAGERAPLVEVALRLADGLTLVDGPRVTQLSLAPAAAVRLDYTVRCAHWGGYRVGDVFVRAQDTLGCFTRETRVAAAQVLRVYPHPELLRKGVPGRETQVFAGNELSRMTGDGIEFAETRPFVAGDRVRRINWRLTARLGAAYVNDLHSERNTDVILFLDVFVDAPRGDGGTHDDVVRAAATLAEYFLQRRDRVGVVSFGGILRWLRPAMGRIQRYRIFDTLIDTDVVFSYAWKEITVIPPSVLPPKAMVIALTPLIDQRSIKALLDLRARGYDVVIFEITPASFAATTQDEAGKLADRIWQLDREVTRDRFRRLGVPIAAWDDGQAFATAVQEVQQFRRA